MTREARRRLQPSRRRHWRRSLLGGLAALLLSLCLYSEWLGFKAARDHPPTGSFETVGDTRLHYRDMPPQHGSKGTVVLIHGAWVAHADLLASLSPLLRDYRVIAIDRPGQGWSERPDDWTHAEPGSQAATVMELLDRIAPEPFVLAGYSLGGALSIRIALDRPERVRSLVLIAAVTHPWLGEAARYHHGFTSPISGPVLNRMVAIPTARLLAEQGIQSAFAPQASPSNYETSAELPLLFREETYRRNLQDIIATDAALGEQARRYRELKVPLVAITGDRDRFVSPAHHSAMIAREVPNGRLIVLPGVGHMPHRAQPETIASIIRELWS